jgi:hypothetical protein
MDKTPHILGGTAPIPIQDYGWRHDVFASEEFQDPQPTPSWQADGESSDEDDGDGETPFQPDGEGDGL